MADKKEVLNTVKQYADAVTKQLSPTAIVLFGSHVGGEPKDESDIDVAVIFDGFSGDWLKTSSDLWRLRRSISYKIEPHLLDAKADVSGFVKHVINTGQIVYQMQK
ncbi:MAG: nucleotidyltransferase domain-containing protein [Oscillospiraceae bacterium]|nr:nucleotidyltransferase domain-containing protein [Oscillospiraceae bacterium]MCL2279671.1 nucleotidyltransferase domain-containing protein [Oscillospiraceae bacterium]